MPIKLPRLTWELDCEPLGYPGLVFTFWLNPPLDLVEEPEKGVLKKREPWEDAFFYNLAAVLDRVTISAEYTDDASPGGEVVVETPDAKAVWELQTKTLPDPQVVLWASGRYRVQRAERLQVAAKN